MNTTMNARTRTARTLDWKELREQGPLTLMIAVVGIAAAGLLRYWVYVSGGLLVYSSQQPWIVGILLGAAALQATISGANSLAGERESGTLEFLEHVAGGKRAVWWSKLQFALASNVAVLIVLLIAVLATSADWRPLAWLPLVMVACYGCAMLCSTFTKSSLAACGLGTLLVLVGAGASVFLARALAPWEQDLPNIAWPSLLFAFVVPGLVAMGVGRAIYCRDEPPDPYAPVRSRRLSTVWHGTGLVATLWLVWRQNRIAMGVMLAVGVLLAAEFRSSWVEVSQWPPSSAVRIVTWSSFLATLGLAGGVLSLAGEGVSQNQRLWADLRLPARRMALLKLAVWAAVVVVAAVPGRSWLVALRTHVTYQAPEYWSDRVSWIDALALFQGLFIGWFTAHLVRKPLPALVVALLFGLPASAVWLPSLMANDFAPWTALVPAVLLLLTSCSLAWPWACEQLTTRTARLRLGLGVSAVLVSVIGILGYRVWSIPDIKSNVATAAGRLPQPIVRGDSTVAADAQEWITLRSYDGSVLVQADDGSGQGVLIRPVDQWFGQVDPRLNFQQLLASNNITDLPEWRRRVADGPGDPGGSPDADSTDEQGIDAADPGIGGGGMGSGEAAADYPSLDEIFSLNVSGRILRWDQLPAGEFSAMRHATDGSGYPVLQPAVQFADWLLLRDLQIVDSGKSKLAIEHLAGTFALLRAIRAQTSGGGLSKAVESERIALAILDRWLGRHANNNADPALLVRAAEILARHERECPSAQAVILGDWFRDTEFPHKVYDNWGRELVTSEIDDLLWIAPWELARRERITKLAVDGWSEALQLSYLDQLRISKIEQLGRPWIAPAALKATPAQAERLRKQIALFGMRVVRQIPSVGTLHDLGHASFLSQANLRGTRIVVAAVRFHLENGRYPKQLDELVPEFLPSLPLDPYTGESFELDTGIAVVPGYRFMGGGSSLVVIDPDGEPEPTIVWSAGTTAAVLPAKSVKRPEPADLQIVLAVNQGARALHWPTFQIARIDEPLEGFRGLEKLGYPLPPWRDESNPTQPLAPADTSEKQ